MLISFLLKNCLHWRHIPRVWMIWGTISILITVAILGSNVEASSNADDWSPVVHLPSEVATRWVTIVTGNASDLHAFWATAEPGDPGHTYSAQYFTVMYSRSTDGSTWDIPVDVIFDPEPLNALTAVSTGSNFHLFWNSDCVRYATVSLESAYQPRLWMESVKCIAPRAIYESVSATVDKHGTIYLVYSTGDTLHLSISTDEGTTWRENSTTVALATQSGGATLVTFPKIAVSESGNLYVVWTGLASNQQDNISFGIFFAQSSDQGQTWSVPFQLAEELNTQPSLAVVEPDQVHVVWNTSVQISKRFHRWSSDGGYTWSPLVELLSGVRGGIQGSPGIEASQNGRVNVLVGTDFGVRFRSWTAGQWSEPEILSLEGEGESWVTGITTLGDTRVCVYWATTPAFSIRCKGKIPFTEQETITTTQKNNPQTTSNTQSAFDRTESLSRTSVLARGESRLARDKSASILDASVGPVQNSGPAKPVAIGIVVALAIVLGVVSVRLLTWEKL